MSDPRAGPGARSQVVTELRPLPPIPKRFVTGGGTSAPAAAVPTSSGSQQQRLPPTLSPVSNGHIPLSTEHPEDVEGKEERKGKSRLTHKRSRSGDFMIQGSPAVHRNRK